MDEYRLEPALDNVINAYINTVKDQYAKRNLNNVSTGTLLHRESYQLITT